MASTVMITASKIKSASDIEQIIQTAEKSEEKLALLLAITKNAVENTQTKPFLLLSNYIQAHFDNTNLQDLDELTIAFVLKAHDKSIIQQLLQKIDDKQKLETLLSRAVDIELSDSALRAILIKIAEMGHYHLLKYFYLEQPIKAALQVPLNYLSARDFLELLSEIKSQVALGLDDSSLYAKQNALFNYALKQFIHRSEKTITLVKSNYFISFIEHFLKEYQHFDNAPAILLAILDNATITSRNVPIIEGINQCLMNCLQKVASTKEVIALLAAHEKCIGIGAIFKLMVESIAVDKRNQALLLPYIESLNKSELMNFLSLAPSLDKPIIISLFKKLDEADLMTMLTLAHSHIDSSSNTLKQCLYEYIANFYKQATPENLTRLLDDAKGSLEPEDYSYFVTELFELLKGHALQQHLIITLVSQLNADDFERHRKTVLPYIRTFVIETLTTHKSFMMQSAKTVLSLLPFSSQDFTETLLNHYHRCAKADEFFNLCFHLQSTKFADALDKAIGLIARDPKLTKAFLRSDNFEDHLIVKVISSISSDLLIDIIIENAQSQPTPYDENLLLELSKRITTNSLSDTLVTRIHEQLFATKSIALAMIQSAECISELCSPATQTAGVLQYIPGISYLQAKDSSPLANGINALLDNAKTFIDDNPLKQLAINLLILHSKNPSKLVSLLEILTAYSTQKDIVLALKKSLFRLVLPTETDTDFDELALHLKLQELCEEQKARPLAYTEIAKDLAVSDNFNQAAKQLEMVQHDLGELNFSDWSTSALANILRVSTTTSINWTHAAELVRCQFNQDDKKQQLTINLIESILCDKDASRTLKEKASLFIDENLANLAVISSLSLEHVQIVCQHLKLDTKQNHELVLARFLNRVKCQSPSDYEHCATLLAQKLLADEQSVALLGEYIDVGVFSSPKFLATIVAKLSDKEHVNESLISPLISYVSEKYNEKEKKHFITLLCKQSPCLSSIEKLLPLIHPISLSSMMVTDEDLSDNDVVKSIIYAITTSTDLDQSAESHLAFKLLTDTIKTLRDKTPSWENKLVEQAAFIDFLNQAFSCDNETIHQDLCHFVSILSFHMLHKLGDKLTTQHQYHKIIESVLSTDAYNQLLDEDRYIILFNLLPSANKQQLAKTLLSDEPIADYIIPYVKQLSVSLNPATLYQLFEKHHDKKLFATLTLMQLDTFKQLETNELENLLRAINSAAEVHYLLEDAPPEALNELVKHLLQLNKDKKPTAWLNSLNLTPIDLIKFCNHISDSTLKTALLSEIIANRASYQYYGLEYQLKEAVQKHGLCKPIYQESLLGTLIREWIKDPDFFTSTTTDVLSDIAQSVSVDEMAEVFDSQEQQLHLSQQVHELLRATASSACIQSASVTARWLIYLPIISESYIHSRYFLAEIIKTVKDDTTEQISPELIAIFTDIKRHVEHPVSHHIEKPLESDLSNTYYLHIQKLDELIKRAIRKLSSENIDYLLTLNKTLSTWQSSINEALKIVDVSVAATKDFTFNIDLFFYPDSRFLPILEGESGKKKIDYLNASERSYWENQFIQSVTHVDTIYTNKLKGLQKAVASIVSTYNNDRLITQSKRRFIRQALTSPHPLFKDAESINAACSMLTPVDLDAVFKLFQTMKQHQKLVEPILYPLRNMNLSIDGPDYIVEFLEKLSSYSYETLKQLYQAAMMANAGSLASVTKLIITIIESGQPNLATEDGQAYLAGMVIPKAINFQAEEIYLDTDIEKTINSIYQNLSRYALVYQSALSYSERKAKHAHEILTTLSAYDHAILSGQSFGVLLNSYKDAISDGSLDIEAIEIALFNLFGSCNYEKQCEILRSLDSELNQKVLQSTISGLSSPAIDRRERSAKLLDVYTAYCQRNDVNNIELQTVIKQNLSQDHFGRYADKLGGLIIGLTKEQASETYTERTTKALDGATYDGVWIQRIITNPSVVAKLTAHEFHELIERYRLLSKFLKRDEYEAWEEYSPKAIHQLKLEHEKYTASLSTSLFNPGEREAREEDIKKLQQRIEHLEDKKRRLLEFKASDAIRELLNQLQENIRSAHWEIHDSAQATFNQYLKLQLADYKADILSRTSNRLYQTMVANKGDLQRTIVKESSFFTRLIDKYVRHDNFVNDELLSTTTYLTKGTTLYSRNHKPVCVLGDGFSLNYTQIHCNDKSLTLPQKSLKPGTELYTHDKKLIGYVSRHSTLEPNTFFQATTSASFLSFISMEEIAKLPNALPLLFKDILVKQSLSDFYAQVFSDDSDCLREKQQWICKEMHKALLAHKDHQLSENDCKQLAAHHHDFFALIENAITTHNKELAIKLIKAWLADRPKVLSFMRDGELRERLYDYLKRLVMVKEDIIPLTTHLFNHEYAEEVRNILDTYAYTLPDTISHQEHDAIVYIKSQEKAPLSLLSDCGSIKLELLTEKMIKQLTKSCRLNLLLCPSSYVHLTKTSFQALIHDLAEEEKESLFHYLIKHSGNDLFKEKVVARIIENDCELFFNCLSQSKSANRIKSLCLTNNEILLLLCDYISAQHKKHPAIRTISQYFNPTPLSLFKHIGLSDFIYAANCYLEGYNHSIELKTLLTHLINERLGDFIDNPLLRDGDLQTIVALLKHPDFLSVSVSTPLSKGVYNRVMEQAAVNGKTAVFYHESGRLNTDLVAMTLKRSMAEEIYDNLSSKERNNPWNTVKKAFSIGNKLSLRLPWVGRHAANSWQEFKDKSWRELEQMQTEVKAIDLFLVKHPSVGDTTRLETLLNDYLLTFYRQDSGSLAFIPRRKYIKQLHSTIALLNNEFVSSGVKRVIFNAINKHPRLRDESILQAVSNYNFDSLLRCHGERQEYEEIIALDKSRDSFADVKQPLLDRAIREAKLEKSIAEMTASFFKPVVVWFKRVWAYGFNFSSFSANQPVYVKKARIGVPVTVTAQVSESSYASMRPLTETDLYGCHHLVRAVLEIRSHLNPSHHDEIIDILQHTDDKQFSYQTTIEEEIAFREALNQLYIYAFSQDGLLTESQGLDYSLQSKLSSTNRERLIELYRYQETTNHERSSDIKACLAEEEAHQSQRLGGHVQSTALARVCLRAGIGSTVISDFSDIQQQQTLVAAF